VKRFELHEKILNVTYLVQYQNKWMQAQQKIITHTAPKKSHLLLACQAI